MQKYVNLVDLIKNFPTSVYLQISASIQPRSSLSKSGGNSIDLFIRVLTRHAGGESPGTPADRQLSFDPRRNVVHRPTSQWLGGKLSSFHVRAGLRSEVNNSE